MSTDIHPLLCRDNSYLEHHTIEDALKITATGRRFSLRFKRSLWMATGCVCAYCGSAI